MPQCSARSAPCRAVALAADIEWLAWPYDDDEAQRLARTAFERITFDDVAEVFFTDTLHRFPTWFSMCKTSRQFLEMQPEVHNTFAHGLQHPEQRNAVRDKFRLDKLDDELVVHYRSPNRLCDLYRAITRQVLRAPSPHA
jgi:hypothetical protein